MGLNVSQLENAVKSDLTTPNLKQDNQQPTINDYEKLTQSNRLSSRSLDFPPVSPKIYSRNTSLTQDTNFFSQFADANPTHLLYSLEGCTIGNDLSRSSCRLSKILSHLGEEEII